MSTKSKITILMVLTSLVGAIVFGLLSYLESRDSLREAAFEELTAIRTARAQQVGEYFDSVFDEASVITENPTVRRALVEFRDAFAALESDATIAAVPYDDALERYYEATLLPALRNYIDRGDVDAQTFMPRTDAGRYLQFRFMAEPDLPYADLSDLVRSEGDTRYEQVHASFHESMRFIRDEFGYYDIFLIDAQTGDVVYTVDKESDFATNIYDGPYRSSGLGDLVETIKDDPTRRAVHFQDLQFYLPSLGKPAIFVGSSIYEGNRVAGILAIQLSNDDLNAILTAGGNWENVGLKSTGETYVVGPDGTLRNESRFFSEDPETYYASLEGTRTSPETIARIRERKTSVLLQKVDTEATRAAFGGETATRVVKDYRGVEVLSAYQPVEIDGNAYAFLAEIDAEEAFKPVEELALRMVITSAVVIPLTALIGVWAASMIMAPARQMRATAQAFLDGEEGVRFQDQSSDEWGQLGQTLNAVVGTSRTRLSEATRAREDVQNIVTRLMPAAVGERYRAGERDLVSHAETASSAVLLLSLDPKFNDHGSPESAAALYDALDDRLDALAAGEGVDLLNQAGMDYVAFCGLTAPMSNHAERVFRFCERAAGEIAAFNREHDTDVRVRGGLSSAGMFGALVGTISSAYEIWGPTVRTSLSLAHAATEGSLCMDVNAHVSVGRTDAVGKPVSVTGLDGESLDAVMIADLMRTDPTERVGGA